jgi:hypothetical protein
MLASGFWQQRKGGDTHVLGSTLTLDGEPYTVIGVLPPMVGLGSVDLWVPVGLAANDPTFTRPNHPGLIGVGRLRRGVTIGQMNQDLARISREIAAEHPSPPGLARRGIRSASCSCTTYVPRSRC